MALSLMVAIGVALAAAHRGLARGRRLAVRIVLGAVYSALVVATVAATLRSVGFLPWLVDEWLVERSELAVVLSAAGPLLPLGFVRCAPVSAGA